MPRMPKWRRLIELLPCRVLQALWAKRSSSVADCILAPPTGEAADARHVRLALVFCYCLGRRRLHSMVGTETWLAHNEVTPNDGLLEPSMQEVPSIQACTCWSTAYKLVQGRGQRGGGKPASPRPQQTGTVLHYSFSSENILLIAAIHAPNSNQ